MFVTLPYLVFAWYLVLFGLAFQFRAKEVAESPLHREAPLVHVPLYHLWVLKWLAIAGAIVLISLQCSDKFGWRFGAHGWGVELIIAALVMAIPVLYWVVHSRYVWTKAGGFKFCLKRDAATEVSLHVHVPRAIKRSTSDRRLVIQCLRELRPVLRAAALNLPANVTDLVVVSPWFADTERKRFLRVILMRLLNEEFPGCTFEDVHRRMPIVNSAVSLVTSTGRKAWRDINGRLEGGFKLQQTGFRATGWRHVKVIVR